MTLVPAAEFSPVVGWEQMATATHIPLSEYLQTSYRPDREFIDGAMSG